MGKKTQLFNSKLRALQAGFAEENITENGGIFYASLECTSKKELKVSRTTKEMKVEGIKETKSDSHLKINKDDI